MPFTLPKARVEWGVGETSDSSFEQGDQEINEVRRGGTRRQMTPQFSLRENCDVVPPAGARPESASETVWVSSGSRKLTSEFCGGTSPGKFRRLWSFRPPPTSLIS